MIEKELKNLVKLLKKKATIEHRKVKNDTTHYEGMCKGMWLGYNESANRIEKLMKNTRNSNG